VGTGVEGGSRGGAEKTRRRRKKRKLTKKNPFESGTWKGMRDSSTKNLGKKKNSFLEEVVR